MGAATAPQVRAAALTKYVEVARFVGLDPYEMLRRARINLAKLPDPEQLIATANVASLLEDSARESGCESFGLLMAEARPLGSVGALGLLLKYQPTVRGVIEAIVRYQALLGDAIVIGLADSDGTTTIRTGIVEGLGGRQGVELLMGYYRRVLSAMVDGRWRPESVHFTHGAPADLAVHRRVFQCPLVFESGFNGFVCPTNWLDAPNPEGESIMARHAERYLETLIADRADRSVAARARRSLSLLLPTGQATLDQLGLNLGLSPRALQRLLDKEGMSFAALLGEVRRELALRYLTGSTHSIATIAEMTGYASPSSFTRWFVAEFGMAPAQWRAEARQAGGEG